MFSKKIFVYLLAVITVTGIITSCEDEKKGCMDPISISYDPEAEVSNGVCAYAGTGGNTTIKASPEHHGVPIVSDSVHIDSAFVKFNAQNSPGSSASAYDLVIAGAPGEDHVHIQGLKPGKYYIMMTGFDTTINMRVTGGIPYTLTVESGEVHVVVPVTE